MENKDKNKKKFLTMEQASAYLGISKSTLYQYTSNNYITYYKPRGRRNYFLKSDLDNFVLNQENKVKSQKEIQEEAENHVAAKRKARKDTITN